MVTTNKREMNNDRVIQKDSRDSMQAQVESFVLARIKSDAWPVGSKVPSERELALELNVSRTTVRNAVLALTSRGLFERSVGQGTFVRRKEGPPAGPRPSTGTLGYVVCKEKTARQPIAREAFYFDVFSGIEAETARSGRHTLFSYLDDFDVEETEAFRSFLDKVDGVVLEEARSPQFLELVRTSGFPVALLAPSADQEGLDLVTMDLTAGVRKAVGYLRGLGHERIAVVNGPLRLEPARVRFQAWQEAIRESGAEAAESLVDGEDSWSAEAGYASMSRLLKCSPELTAVFCANDLLAIGALSALSEAGLRVPGDVSVIGFDDTELARHASPPLTTMRIHSRDMGRAAARRLLERIDSAGLPPVRIEFPIDLVIRKTCKEVNAVG